MDDDVESQRRREECERKARRGEMDPRLEFAFQLLIDGTGLARHQIMDHIFEGDMVLIFDKYFIIFSFGINHMNTYYLSWTK